MAGLFSYFIVFLVSWLLLSKGVQKYLLVYIIGQPLTVTSRCGLFNDSFQNELKERMY